VWSLSFSRRAGGRSSRSTNRDEDQLKRAADLKLWIETRISQLQDEIEKLKEAQTIVDSTLRASSFRPASEMAPRPPQPETSLPTEAPAPDMGSDHIPVLRELRRDKGGETIAVAQVTPERVVIEPVAEVSLRTETPPFKSFLLGKILTGMKSKDDDLVARGRLPPGMEIRFNVAEKGGRISNLTIENYRESERLTEILNTIGWTFSRMLEKGTLTSSR
jgi:hypothetical protein